MVNYTKKFFWNFVLLTIGAVLANAFGYLLRLFLARNLTVAEYGLVYAIMALFGFAGLINNLGLGEAISRYVAKYEVAKQWGRIKQVAVWSVWMLTISSFVTMVLAFLFADWLSMVYLQNPLAASLIRVYAVVVFLSPLSIVSIMFFRGLQRSGLQAFFQTAQSIFLFLIVVWLIRAGFGVFGVMLSYLLVYIPLYLMFGIVVFTSFRWLFKKCAYTFEMPKRLLTYGFAVMLAGIASMVLTYTDTILLTVFRSLDEVGVYQAALPTATLIFFVSGVISTVLLPLAAELWERKKKKLIRVAISELYTYMYFLLLPAVLAMIAYPDFILNLLFGAEFTRGSMILQLLSVSVFFLTMQTINSAVLSGIGLPGKNTKTVAVGASVNLIANFALIPVLGGVGAAIATLFSSIVIFSLGTYFMRGAIPFSLPWQQWFKGAGGSLVFFLILYMGRFLPVASQYIKVSLAILLGGLVYVGILFATKAVHLHELKKMLDRILSRS